MNADIDEIDDEFDTADDEQAAQSSTEQDINMRSLYIPMFLSSRNNTDFSTRIVGRTAFTSQLAATRALLIDLLREGLIRTNKDGSLTQGNRYEEPIHSKKRIERAVNRYMTAVADGNYLTGPAHVGSRREISATDNFNSLLPEWEYDNTSFSVQIQEIILNEKNDPSDRIILM